MADKKIYPTLGELFADLRTKKGMSQMQAKASGISQPHISWLERGVIMPDLQTVQKLKDFYGVEITWKQNGFTFKKIK